MMLIGQFTKMLLTLTTEFYVQNTFTILNGFDRQKWLGILVLLIEHLWLFSLILSRSFIEGQATLDTTISNLKWISLHMISSDYLQSLVYISLSLNILGIVLFVYFFAYFCVRQYNQLSNLFLCILLRNYNSLITIPALVISLRNGSGVFSILSITSTLILMIICSIHSNNFYSFYCQDFLARRGNLWENFRFLAICIGIIVFEAISFTKYEILILVIALVNALAMLKNNLFRNKDISEIYLTLNLSLVLISILVLILKEDDTPHSLVMISLCLITLSYGVAVTLIKGVDHVILNTVDNLTNYNQTNKKNNSSSQDSSFFFFSLFFYQNDKDFLIDYYARHLFKQFRNTKKSKFFGDLFRNIAMFSQNFNQKKEITDIYQYNHEDSVLLEKQRQTLNRNKYSKKSNSNEETGEIGFNSEIINFIYEKTEISKQTMKQNMNFLRRKMLFKTQSSQRKQQIHETNRGYLEHLFYLFEIEKNYPKLFIKIFEQSKRELNLSQLSAVAFLKNQLEDKMKTDTSNGKKLDLAATFEFEENLAQTTAELVECIKVKGIFVKELSKDNIDLQDLERIGKRLLRLIEQLAVRIIDLLSKNPDQSQTSLQLQCNHELFLDTFWIDPTDKSFTMLKLTKKQARIYAERRFNSFQQNIHRNATSVLAMERSLLNSCSVLVSLDIGKVGQIVKMTKNIEQILGFSSFDLQNRSIDIFMPSAIASVHNQLMLTGIDRGLVSQLEKNKLFIAKKKDQFGMKFNLKLQVHVLQQNGIGLIGRLESKEKEERMKQYILADVSNGKSSIEVVSKGLFENIFGHYFASVSEIDGVQLHQLIPCLTNIAETLKGKSNQALEYQSLVFLPQKFVRSERRKRRFQDQTQNFFQNAAKKYYEYGSNDVFKVDLKIKYYFRPGIYEMILVKIRSVEMIKSKVKYIELLGNSYVNHLCEMKVIQNKETGNVLDILSKEEDLYAQSSGASGVIRQNQSTRQSFRIQNSKDAEEYLAQLRMNTDKQDSNSSITNYFDQETDRKDGHRNQQFKLKLVPSELTQASEAKLVKEGHTNNNNHNQNSNQNGYPTHGFTANPIIDDLILLQSNSPKLQRKSSQLSSEFSRQESISKPSIFQQQIDSPKSNTIVSQRSLKPTMLPYSKKQLFAQDQRNTLDLLTPHSPKYADTKQHTFDDFQSQTRFQSVVDKDEQQHVPSKEMIVQQDQQLVSKEDELSNHNNMLSPGFSSDQNLQKVLFSKPNKLIDSKQNKGFSRSYSTYLKKVLQNQQNIDEPSQSFNASSQQKAKTSRIAQTKVEDNFNNKNNHSSQSKEEANVSKKLRQIVNRKVTEQKSSNILKVLFGYILCSFIGMLFIVGISFALLQIDIAAEQLSSEFSWWYVTLSNRITTMLRLNEVHSVIQMNAFAFSSDPNVIALDNQIGGKVLSAFQGFSADIKSLSTHDPSDLEFVSFIHSILLEYQTFSITTMVPTTRSMIMYDSLFFFSLNSLQMSFESFIYKQITLLEILSNSAQIQAALIILGEKQDASRSTLSDGIQSSVNRQLILISVISGVIALILIQFNSFFIFKKEFVLKLFASIEPACILSMQQSLELSLEVLENNSEQQQFPIQNQLIQKNNYNIGKDNVQPSKGKGMNMNRRQRDFKYSGVLGQIVTKKKKNVSSSRLPKINLKLILQIVLVTCLINVQPIVNVILTSQQLQESNTQQSIVKGLYSLESSLQSLEFVTFIHAQLVKDPYSQYVPMEIIIQNFATSVPQIKELLSGILSSVFELSQNSRYENTSILTFLGLIFTSNTCLGLKLFPSSASSSFSYDKCISLYEGVFTHGYSNVAQTFYSIFSTYWEITAITNSADQVQQVEQFFVVNDPLVLEELLEYLSIITESVVSIITEENKSYFKTVKTTQYLLFSWEILLLVIIFPVLIFPLFTRIKKSMLSSIRMISLLQLPNLLSNQYIFSYLQIK